MSQKELPPDTLYRGIVIPTADVSQRLITANLRPGTRKEMPDGSVAVLDGNEYGVYMSDNPHMTEVAYASPRHNTDALDEYPDLKFGHGNNVLGEAKTGVLYEIDTRGLQVRKPTTGFFLKSGHYNNGFQGDEWIAEEIPSEKVSIKKLILGADALHVAEEWEPGRSAYKILDAIRAVREAREQRLGGLRLLGESLSTMPQWKRRDPHHVQKAIKSVQKTHSG